MANDPIQSLGSLAQLLQATTGNTKTTSTSPASQALLESLMGNTKNLDPRVLSILQQQLPGLTVTELEKSAPSIAAGAAGAGVKNSTTQAILQQQLIQRLQQQAMDRYGQLYSQMGSTDANQLNAVANAAKANETVKMTPAATLKGTVLPAVLGYKALVGYGADTAAKGTPAVGTNTSAAANGGSSIFNSGGVQAPVETANVVPTAVEGGQVATALDTSAVAPAMSAAAQEAQAADAIASYGGTEGAAATAAGDSMWAYAPEAAAALAVLSQTDPGFKNTTGSIQDFVSDPVDTLVGKGSIIGNALGAVTGGGGGCFITTAVCQFTGLPDDCDTLEVLRAFRDKWVAVHHPESVTQYYAEAPAIAKALLAHPDASAICTTLAVLFITPAVTAIELEEYEVAFELYSQMFNLLKGI